MNTLFERNIINENVIYRVAENDLSDGETYLHHYKFNTESDAEDYIEGLCEEEDMDSFGEVFTQNPDYDYTTCELYSQLKIVLDADFS